MKEAIKIFFYMWAYKRPMLLNILFNGLSIIFSVFSLAMIFPFLSLLFDSQALVTEVPEFELKATVIIEYFYYYLSNIIAPDGTMTLEGQSRGLFFICTLVSVLFLLKNMFRYLAVFFMASIRYGVVKDIRNNVYSKILMLPFSYFTERRKGDLLARMTTDILEIEVSIIHSIEAIFKDPVIILVFITALFVISPSLTIFVIVLLPISGYLIGKVGKSLKKTSVKGQAKIGMLISVIEETLSGLRVIKAFTAEKFSFQKFMKVNDDTCKIFIRMQRKRDLSSPMSEYLGIMVMVVILWFGGKIVLSGGSLGPEMFITYIVMFSQIISPSKSFATAYFNIQKGVASLDRINVILDETSTIPEKANPDRIKSFEKSIEFKDLSFSYSEVPTLKNINLKIPKGHTIALVGQSGSGKTTIANLLPRFYDYQQGSIILDGKPIKDYHLKDLRKLMGIVTQESILFNDSVRNNIAFGMPEASLEQVIDAAKIANAHEFIEKLAEGYDTNIGDSGSRLSGGQKQRLSIARAILKNPPILILDEATSALDTESERMVQDAISKLMENRTSVVIAHRLSTIQHADEICVVQDGEIIERGKHKDLINQNGAYKRLHDMQAFK